MQLFQQRLQVAAATLRLEDLEEQKRGGGAGGGGAAACFELFALIGRVDPFGVMVEVV